MDVNKNHHMDAAKVHADTPIHKRNASNQMIKLSRFDAVVKRIESTLKQKQATKMSDGHMRKRIALLQSAALMKSEIKMN